MKKIAIITPHLLPVPAVKGGAVEELITKLIYGNEMDPQYLLDVYTLPDEKLKEMSFHHTRLIMVDSTKCIHLLDRVLDKLGRFLHWNQAVRLLDRRIVAKVCKETYDIIVIENMSSLYRAIYRKVNVPIFFHIHNLVDLYRSPSDLRLMCERGDHVWAISRFMRSELKLVAPKLNCDLFFNGVDRKRYFPIDSEQKKKYRNSWKLDPDRIIFLYSGRIIPEKGVIELLQAFGKVQEKYPQVALVIVGSTMFGSQKITPYQRKVMDYVEQLSNIKFTGFVDPEKMSQIYGCADIVVMPSLWNEPFGMVALETLSMGIPLIVTNRGGLPEVVSKSCAKVIDVGENFVDQLAIAMMELIQTPSQLINMKKLALEHMKCNKQFDDCNYFYRFCELIEGK